jgi:L-ascorbate metabolism protein UlaG (beta-lactamase superfamily)
MNEKENPMNRPCGDTHGGLVLTWLGNAGFSMVCEGRRLLIDPVIELKDEADPTISEGGHELIHPLPLRACDVDHCDLCLVTHHHMDHLAPKTIGALRDRTDLFVGPATARARFEELGVDSARLRTLAPGETLVHASFSIEAVRAAHGGSHGALHLKAFSHPEEVLGVGYVITVAGHSVYHPGDTVLLEEHFPRGAPPNEMPPTTFERLETLLLPIVEHTRTLRRLPELLAPKYVVPMHYDTYKPTARTRFWTYGDPREVRDASPIPERFVLLEQGQAFRPGSASSDAERGPN